MFLLPSKVRISHKNAFTLIELIVVITILAILGTIAFISYENYTVTARASATASKITQLNTTLGVLDAKGDVSPRMVIEHSGALATTGTILGGTVTLVPGSYDTPGTNYSVGPLKREYYDKLGVKEDMTKDDQGNSFILASTNLLSFNGSKIRLTQAAWAVEKDGASVPVIQGWFMQLTSSDVSGLIKGINGTPVIENGSVPYLVGNLPALSGTGAHTETPVVITPSVGKIAAGDNHTCAITTAGWVKCWGYNVNGELGNNTTTNFISAIPVDVSSLSSGITSIAIWANHTCALTTAGGVKCWGYNGEWELGNNTTTNSAIPVDVSGLSSGVAAIAARSTHTCALTTAWGVKCWGDNNSGQLGNNTTTNSPTPIDVSGLTSGVTSIATWSNHTCAITTGWVKCWGDNNSGQLGNGTTNSSLVPVDVSDISSGISTITAWDVHTCVLSTSGWVKCWGYNDEWELGNGTTNPSLVPVEVPDLGSGVTIIAAWNSHTCAITTAGGLKCWGYNGSGQLGNNTTTDSTTPVDVSGLTSGIAAVASWSNHTCVLTTSGGVKCWGYNGNGQLGGGITSLSLVPISVSSLSSSISIVVTGDGYTCALTTAGGVKCWGDNSSGQLGNGTTDQSTTPVDVSGLSSWVSAIAAGSSHTCVLTTAGWVKCWGYNWNQRIRQEATDQFLTPVDIPGFTDSISAIATGDNHTCALTTAGGVRCWGDNWNGQLGNGVQSALTAPVDVSGLLSGVSAIAAGYRYTCALTTAGGVKCWGMNMFGQLGNGTTNWSSTPVGVSDLASGVTKIATWIYHTCALTTAGGVKCWGMNDNWQLGNWINSGGDPITTPTDVSNLSSGVSAISINNSHSCALITTGWVKCWGSNGFWQLGNSFYYTTPIVAWF